MGRRGMHVGFWWESQKNINHKEDLYAGERIILKWILERKDWVVWTGLMWSRVGKTVMNIRVPLNVGKFRSS
jgi:hypothetical protein